MKLKRLQQCAKCPWRKDVNPHDIPNGYTVEKHKALKSTISDGVYTGDNSVRAMSCHEHSTEEGVHCVGWLHNQLGAGNNIPLRLAMLDCENVRHIKLVGEQHATFEDTLPDEE